MTRTSQILNAINDGADTSGQIARAVKARRGAVSVALCRLSDLGLVERAGSVTSGNVGRPFVRWRARKSKASL